MKSGSLQCPLDDHLGVSPSDRHEGRNEESSRRGVSRLVRLSGAASRRRERASFRPASMIRVLMGARGFGIVGGILATALFAAWPMAALANTTQPSLLTAGNYAVMAGSTITNTGATLVNGNMALSPGSAVTGFTGPPNGTATGTTDISDAAAVQAQTDLVTTYNEAAAATGAIDMSGVDLGGHTLTPGVYSFSSSAQLTGTLTLDGEGATNPTFIFQIGTTLTTASAAQVLLTDGAGACAVFWQVGSSATLGTTTSFQGNLLALSSITMNTGATMGVGGGLNGGRALARNAAVTLDDNVITPPPSVCTYAAAATPTPTPSAASSSPTPTTAVPATGAFSETPGGFPGVLIALAALGGGVLLTSTGLRIYRHRAR